MHIFPSIAAIFDLHDALPETWRNLRSWGFALLAVFCGLCVPALLLHLNPPPVLETPTVVLPVAEGNKPADSLILQILGLAPEEEPAEPDAAAKDVTDLHEAHQAELYFSAGMILYLVVGMAVLLAQRRVIRRHISIFSDRTPMDRDSDQPKYEQYLRAERNFPRLRTALWVFLGAVLSAVLLANLPEVMPSGQVLRAHVCDWMRLHLQDYCEARDLAVVMAEAVNGGVAEALAEAASRARIEMEPPQAIQTLQLIANLVMSGMMVAAIAITAYGTQTLARNYPPVRVGLKIRDRFIRDIRRHHSDTETLPNQPDLLSQPLEKKLSDQSIAEIVKFVIDQRAVRVPDRFRAVSRGMKAEDLASVVRLLSRALLILMLLALVMASLGTPPDSKLADNEVESAAIKESYRAWIMMMGLGFSLSLAVCYALPIMRLNPYIEAERDEGGSKTAWSLKTDESGGAIKASPVNADAPPENFPPELTHFLGANREKFVTILSGSQYGGGFHMVLENELMRQILWIAGLLAPTLAGGILANFI